MKTIFSHPAAQKIVSESKALGIPLPSAKELYGRISQALRWARHGHNVPNNVRFAEGAVEILAAYAEESEKIPVPAAIFGRDPTNEDRAKWADVAIRAFQAATGSEDEDALGDLLCDLMHWADAEDRNFGDSLSGATMHYSAEREEEQEELGSAPFTKGTIVLPMETPAETNASLRAFKAITGSEFLEALDGDQSCLEETLTVYVCVATGWFFRRIQSPTPLYTATALGEDEFFGSRQQAENWMRAKFSTNQPTNQPTNSTKP